MVELWLFADDTAAHLGVTQDTVYTWIAEKAMPAHKVGRLWRFQTSEINEWGRAGAAASDAEPSTVAAIVSGQPYPDRDQADEEGCG